MTPPIDLSTKLSNLPPPTPSANSLPLQLLRKILVYPPNERLSAKAALGDPWFQDVVVPLGYAEQRNDCMQTDFETSRDGLTLGEMVLLALPMDEALKS